MSEKSLKERFQEKMDGSRWTGSTNNIGYPKMKVDGEMVLGSHVALRLAGRKVPTGGPGGGKIVMHKDNNKLNLSPSNLEVGTHEENLKQMRDEGRDRPRGVHQEPDEKQGGIDILKFAFKLQDAKLVARAAKSRIVKPPSAVSPTAGGPAFLPTASQAIREGRRSAGVLGIPTSFTDQAASTMSEGAGNLGGKVVWPRRGDATSFLRDGAVKEDDAIRRSLKYMEDMPPEMSAGVKAIQQQIVSKADALRAVSSPSDRRLMDGVIKSHELAEGRVTPQVGMAHFGHRSPKVILQEQNAVATLPSGSAVGPAMSSLRRGREADVLRSVGVDYGAKRYSRHAVKHLSNEIERNAVEQFKQMHGEKFAFKLQGHTEHQGIPIAIENRKGSVRKGVDKDGKPWRTVMKMPYGYIKGSKGADGEDIDCYVGPHKDAPNAYVVHQRKSDGTGYDEDKVLFGLRNKDDAIKRYLQHYNSDKFLGPVKEVPVERLKEMLSTGKKLEKISTSLCARVLRRG